MRPNEYDDLLKKIRCSDDFRSRMQEKLSAEPSVEPEFEEIISDRVEVITSKRRWGRIAAAAAAFVIIGGAAGGTAYHFSKVNSDNVITDKDGNKFVDDGSIYAALRKNKDSYFMKSLYVNDGEVVTMSLGEEFYDYMDNNESSEVSEDEFKDSKESVVFYFTPMAVYDGQNSFSLSDEDPESYDFRFEIYDNGCYKWNEKTEDSERVSYHRFENGEDAYNYFLSIQLSGAITYVLTKTENNSLIDDLMESRDMYSAYLTAEDENNTLIFQSLELDTSRFFRYLDEYTENDEDRFKELMPGEYQPGGCSLTIEFYDEEKDKTNYSYTGANPTYNYKFKLYDNSCFILTSNIGGKERAAYYRFETPAFIDILSLYAEDDIVERLNKMGRAASKTEILSAFNEDYNGESAKFRKDSGQFTGDTDVTVSDFEGLKNELASLEWVTCDVSDENIYKDFYIAGALIGRNGYIYSQSGGTHYFAYKLKNDSDIETFREILDSHFTEDSEETSIYSRLIADKESYSVDLSDDIKKKDIDKDRLLEYLDNYDMSSEIGPGEFSPSEKKITVFFRKIGEADKEYSYVGANEKYAYKLVIYDSGAFTWTENNNGKEKLTMHSFADDGKVYQDILDMFAV